MAMEVLAINPSRKRGKKKGVKKMANNPTKKTKRKTKKNPSAKAIAKRVGSRAKQRFLGMNLGAAFRGAPPRIAGMFAAKWAAKKMPGVSGGGGDREDWTMSNYIAGSAGGLIAGFIAENLKRGSGQKVLEGAIDLMLYKLVENEVVYRSEWLTNQFGAEDDVVLLGEEEDADPGDLLLGDDGEIYMMGQDGYTRPIGEQHRQLAAQLAQRALMAKRAGMGDALAPVNPALGADPHFAPVTPMLGDVDPYARMYESSRW